MAGSPSNDRAADSPAGAGRHAARYESGIGDDGVLGPEWAAIGGALLALLNGESGRLDCGTLDGLIRANLTAEGIDPDTL